MSEHDWQEMADWMGDPNVINGTCQWKYYVCRQCGVEVGHISDAPEECTIARELEHTL